MAKKKPKQSSGTIALNKRAKHDFHIETKFEAGIALTGWEVKSMRAGMCQLVDSHVFLKNGEAFLLGARIEPLKTASTHVIAEPMRYRKLLLHRRELAKIHQAVNQKGHTCIATAIYWKKHLVKLEICLAKGKKDHDKRATLKEQQGKIEVGRAMRERNK